MLCIQEFKETGLLVEIYAAKSSKIVDQAQKPRVIGADISSHLINRGRKNSSLNRHAAQIGCPAEKNGLTLGERERERDGNDKKEEEEKKGN